MNWDSRIEALERLNSLREAGALSLDEFSAEKSQILMRPVEAENYDPVNVDVLEDRTQAHRRFFAVGALAGMVVAIGAGVLFFYPPLHDRVFGEALASAEVSNETEISSVSAMADPSQVGESETSEVAKPPALINPQLFISCETMNGSSISMAACIMPESQTEIRLSGLSISDDISSKSYSGYQLDQPVTLPQNFRVSGESERYFSLRVKIVDGDNTIFERKFAGGEHFSVSQSDLSLE